MTPDLLDTSKLIVGASGSGKTVTAKDEVGQLLDQRRQVVVVDPTGVWWGMRSTPDGEGGGYDLPIFGGEHGDLPVPPDQGRAIARIILEQRVSAIVDLSAIDNSADWRLFMDGFVSGLRKGVRGNFHLVVDEADEFAAERAADGFGFALRENLVWIAKRGRTQGFVPTWITQRPADIAKAVISQAQTIVAHQLILAHDQKAIDDYLKGKGSADVRSQVMGSLAELQVGERWIYSPRLKLLERGVTPALATFDSSRTPAPGERVVQPRTLAELDVSAIAAALAPAEPESQISGFPADTIPADPMEAARKGALVGGMLAARDRRIAELEAENAALRVEREELRHVDRECEGYQRGLGAIEKLLDAVRNGEPWPNLHHVDASSGIMPGLEISPSPDPRPVAEEADAPPAGGLSLSTPSGDASDRELRALAGLAAVYPAGLTEAAWAARTCYSRKGGAWIRRRKRYLDAGLIEQAGNRWFATPAGARTAAQLPDLPPPGPALVAWWADRLRAPGRLLKVLAAVHPRALTRDGLAAEAGMQPKGGAFLRYVGELKAAELIVENGKRLAIAPGLMGDV